MDEEISVVIEDPFLERLLKSYLTTDSVYEKKPVATLEDLFGIRNKLLYALQLFFGFSINTIQF